MLVKLGKLGQKGSDGPLLTRLSKAAQSIAKSLGAPLIYPEDNFLKLGPNRIVNGDASTGDFTGWTHPDTAPSVTDVYQNTFRMTAAAGSTLARLRQSITLPNGLYLVSVTASGFTGTPGCILALGNASGGDTTYGSLSVLGNGSFQAVANVTNGFLGLAFTAGSSAGGSIQLSNIRVENILSASIYQDTAGTLPSYMGGVVGLITDRAYGGELGDNLAPVIDATWSTNDAGWAAVGNTAVATNVPGSKSFFKSVSGIVADRTYWYEVTISSYTQGGVSVSVGGTGSGSVLSSAGTFRGIVKTTATNQNINLISGGTTTLTVSNLIVRELKGNHATQATAGNRMTMTRVPRKLGPNLVVNGMFDADANWTKGAGWTISGGKAEKSTGGAGNLLQSYALSAGTSYVVTYMIASISIPTTGSLTFRTAGGTPVIGALRTTAGTYSEVIVAAPGNTAFYLVANSADITASIDNIEVREVLEWCPALGTGATTSEALATNPIGSNLNQPYTIIVAGTVGAIGAIRTMCGDSARLVGIDANGYARVGNSGAGVATGATKLSQGQAVVLTGVYDGTNLRIYVNGALDGINPITAPTTAVGAFYLGQRGNNTEYWNGTLTEVLATGSVIPDSQRKSIEKFMAASLGAPYAG